jgi:hypothetical protein
VFDHGGYGAMVAHQFPMLKVAGSSPACRILLQALKPSFLRETQDAPWFQTSTIHFQIHNPQTTLNSASLFVLVVVR